MSRNKKAKAPQQLRVGPWLSRLERRAKKFEKRSGRLDRLLKQTIQELADEKKAVTQDMREALLQTLLTIKIEMDLLIARDAFSGAETKEKLTELSSRLRDAILGARLFSRLFYTPRSPDVPAFKKGKKRLIAEPPPSGAKPPVASRKTRYQQEVPPTEKMMFHSAATKYTAFPSREERSKRSKKASHTRSLSSADKNEHSHA